MSSRRPSIGTDDSSFSEHDMNYNNYEWKRERQETNERTNEPQNGSSVCSAKKSNWCLWIEALNGPARFLELSVRGRRWEREKFSISFDRSH